MDDSELRNARLTHYLQRHGVKSAQNLTVVTDEIASLIAERLAPRIAGKVVVEIGGATGLLCLHMARYAKQVFCIEANPRWAQYHIDRLIESKPRNASYLFGAAEEFVGHIRGDISIVCTHSGVAAMMRVAAMLSSTTLDVYGEMIDERPEAFDEFARTARLWI